MSEDYTYQCICGVESEGHPAMVLHQMNTGHRGYSILAPLPDDVQPPTDWRALALGLAATLKRIRALTVAYDNPAYEDRNYYRQQGTLDKVVEECDDAISLAERVLGEVTK